MGTSFYGNVSGGGNSSLPAVTSSDNGNVLTVVEGAWNKATPSKELPVVDNSNNGQILEVVNGSWARAWLPSESTIYWVDASGDGETPETFTCGDIANELYNRYQDQGVAINGSMVIAATAEFDDVRGDTAYTFITLAINNGTVTPLVWTAASDYDYPSYTES